MTTPLRGFSVRAPVGPSARNGSSPRSASKAPSRSAGANPSLNRFCDLNAFVDATMRGLSGTAVKIWLALFRDTKPNGLASSSDKSLAERCGVSTRRIRKVRHELVACGLIRIVRRGRLNRGVSVYQVASLASGTFVPLASGTKRPKQRNHGSAIPEEPRRRGDPSGSPASKHKSQQSSDPSPAASSSPPTPNQPLAPAPQPGAKP